MTALAFSLTLAFGLAPAVVLAQEAPVSVSIRAQPLGDALLQLGEQTPLQIFFPQDAVAGLNAPAVSGSLPPEEALRRLLQGTGISYQRNGNSVTLSRAGAAAAPAAGPVAQLAAVTVSAGILGDLLPEYAGGQLATGGSLGLLGAEDIMDSPFSTTNYTAQTIDDQQARTLADVVVNDASVRTLTSTGGFGEDFQIRGFPVGSGDVSVNGLYGLVSASRVPVQIVDRIEVLKGPATLMRGIPPSGSVGGSINLVAKRAADEPLTAVTLGYESKANFTGQFDLGRRFGEDKAWGVRFNGVKRGGEASLEDGDQGLTMGALGVDYRGQRLRWSLDAIHQDDELENIRSQIGWQGDVTELPAAPAGDINFYPGTRLTQRDNTIMSRLEYDFTDNLTGHIGVGYRDGRNRQIFPVTVNPVNGARSSVDSDGNFHVMTTYYDSYSKTLSSDAGLTATFDTGPIAHRVAFGVTYFEQEAGNVYTPNTSEYVASNIYNPAPIAPGLPDRPDPFKVSDTTLRSFAIADTMSFLDDRVRLTLGARRQNVKLDSFNAAGAVTSIYDASATSPVVGVVVKPLGNVSVYANFTEGLTRGTIVGGQYANAGEILAPFKSRQYETGVKVDWGNITTTAALFQIDRPNGAVNEADNTYGYHGQQRNRGLELAAFGEIQPGLRLMASASFIEAELSGTAQGRDDGNRAAGVPSSTYNLGVDWDTPWVQGLSLNGRVIRTSSQYLNTTNTLRLSGVTRLDVGARYRTEVAGKQVVLRANVENLTDKRYWLASGSFVTNAAARTYLLSAEVEF